MFEPVVDQDIVTVSEEKAILRTGEVTHLRNVHVSGDSLETCQKRASLEVSCVTPESDNEN